MFSFLLLLFLSLLHLYRCATCRISTHFLPNFPNATLRTDGTNRSRHESLPLCRPWPSPRQDSSDFIIYMFPPTLLRSDYASSHRGTPGNREHGLGDKGGNRARTGRERHDCHGNNRKKQTVAWWGGDSVRWPLGSPQMLIDPGAGGKTRDACPLAPAHGGPLSLSPWQHPESSRINHTLVAWHLSPPAWPTAQHDMIKRPQAWSLHGGERLFSPTSLRSLTQGWVGDTELCKSSHSPIST